MSDNARIEAPAPASIPQNIYAKLATLRPLLERQGVVQLQQGNGRGVYRLRFREFDPAAGFTRHRSMSLGSDPMITAAVAALIQQWHDEYQRAKAQAEPPPRPKTLPVDPVRGLAQALCGGGWRRRKQIGEWYDKARNDPVEAVRFMFSGEFPAPRKAGRPPKKRLW